MRTDRKARHQPLNRQDSKSVATTCRGFNKSNNLPCRNAVSAQNYSGYCRWHAGTIRVQTDATQRPQTKHARAPYPTTPPTSINVVSSRTPVARTASQTQDNHIARKGRDVEAGTQMPQNGPAAKASHRPFRMSTMLRALFCIPQKSGGTRLSESRVPPAPVRGISNRSEVQPRPSSSLPAVKRKPVDYSQLNDQDRAEILRDKILRDHRELQAALQISSPTQEHQIRPKESPDPEAFLQDLIARYLARSDYPTIPIVTLARLQRCIREAVMSTRPKEPEYIYVFREDGDYEWTEKIVLKIGRTKNVEARLKQWYNQCRHKVEILEAVKSRDAVLVERMLHLDFDADRVLRPCQCGRTHKEWFSINRAGAKGVITRALTKWNTLADELCSFHGNQQQ